MIPVSFAKCAEQKFHSRKRLHLKQHIIAKMHPRTHGSALDAECTTKHQPRFVEDATAQNKDLFDFFAHFFAKLSDGLFFDA